MPKSDNGVFAQAWKRLPWSQRSRNTETDRQKTAQAQELRGDERVAEQARSLAPVVWLLGKVQSGKSSIIRALTPTADAPVGSGFRPCTASARIYDFPPEAPLIRFLDTRGVGEASYDPSEDLAFAEAHAHLLIVVIKALDHQQQAIIDALKQVRQRHSSWPIIVAQTSLHEAYDPSMQHPDPYPFATTDPSKLAAAGVPNDLIRSLAHQRRMFENLPGDGLIAFVPIDFTKPEDGYKPVEYGLTALHEALERIAPQALVTALTEARSDADEPIRRRARPYILGYATAAAAADVVPIAGAVAVPAVQAKLLHKVAELYGIPWDRRAYAEFAAALGGGLLARYAGSYGIRQLAKLIPVYGQTAGAAAAAAMSFTTTYALGRAACVFARRRKAGSSEPGAVRLAYAEALAEALRMVKDREFPNPSGDSSK